MEFLLVLYPIFMIFAIGYIGQKTIGFEIRSLSTMALYLMSPVLAFRTFYEAKFDETYVYIFIYTFGLCICLIGIVYLWSYLKGYSMNETCGMILASAFMNNGNYGTPLALFVFGTTGLHYAVILMVVQQLVMCTVGVYYAAKGSPDNRGVKEALYAVKRMPIVYGAIIGIIFHFVPVPLPKEFRQAVDLVADAAVPTIMIILGMQLANVSVKKWVLEKLSVSLTIKLILSPLVALALTLLFPVEPLLKQIMILMAAMPTAANTTMYALQFKTEPDFVASATLLSTTLSIVTLPILLFILSVK